MPYPITFPPSWLKKQWEQFKWFIFGTLIIGTTLAFGADASPTELKALKTNILDSSEVLEYAKDINGKRVGDGVLVTRYAYKSDIEVPLINNEVDRKSNGRFFLNS